jgi:signal transduction histidine kinase
VRALRRAGAGIDADLAPPPDDVPIAVDIAAFRIVQEALSNAVRHAPHTRIALSMKADAAAVRVVVRNGLPAAAEMTSGAPPQRGHGLLGMRERAALVGGTVRAAPDDDGGWTVRAVLPLTGPPIGSTAGVPTAAVSPTDPDAGGPQ